VELRPDLAEPHGALAQYYYHGLLDFPRALAELATATKIQPSNSAGLLLTSLIFTRQGRFVEAAELMSKAVELDPRNPRMLASFAASCVRVRRYADADHAFGLAIALSPQWDSLHAYRAEVQIKWHGDVDKAQALLDEASHVAGVREAYPEIWQWVSLLRRDYPGVLRQLEAQEQHGRDDPEKHSALLLFRGQVQMLMGQHDLARRSYETARVELEQLVQRAPDDAGFHGSLGIAYAGLGRRADAVREAKLGCELAPSLKDDKDYLQALARLEDLALVYTMLGQPGEAIAVLDDRLSRNGSFTAHMLQLDPAWDPLRSDPRFQALLTKHAVKP
jgi:tetratricopeptide (TPR) repeat protein